MTNQIHRLLIVTDNDANRDKLHEYLEAPEVTIDKASDGEQAIKLLDAQHYDLLLLGVHLPKLSGYQVLEYMKGDPDLLAIPVIMVSSVADSDSVARCIELGADDYIQEPFTKELLEMRIRINKQKQDIQNEQQLHIDRVEKLADQMENVILPMGIALSTETDFDKLAQRILIEAKRICNADAGTLYMRTGDNTLRFAIVITESLNIHLGGTSGQPVNFPPLQLYDRATGAQNIHNVASYVALNGKSINIPNIYEDTGDFDFSATKVFDQRNNYRTISNLTVPLKDNKGEVIGVLQLLNAQDADGNNHPVRRVQPAGGQIALSQAAVVLNNHMLIQQQQKLNKIENDIQIARRIQQNFLPNTLPEVKGWEIGRRFSQRASRRHFYDFFLMMGDRRLGIIIADVCGKGRRRGAVLSLMRSLLRLRHDEP
ncbi:MAG: response regulator [Anaerolineae bacterium]